jgi:hypothetical protein
MMLAATPTVIASLAAAQAPVTVFRHHPSTAIRAPGTPLAGTILGRGPVPVVVPSRLRHGVEYAGIDGLITPRRPQSPSSRA